MENLPITQNPQFLELAVRTASYINMANQLPALGDTASLVLYVDFWDEFRAFYRAVEETRKELTKPAVEHQREINKHFKSLLDAGHAELSRISEMIVDYQTRNNPDKKQIRTENALATLRRNKPVPVVTDKTAFLKAICSTAKGRADLTLDLVTVNEKALLEVLLKGEYIGRDSHEQLKKLPPGVEMQNRPDTLV